MADLIDLPGMLQRFERVRAQAGGGHGPTGGDMEHRVRALEMSVEKIDAKLDKLVEGQSVMRERLASIDAKLDTKASATDLAEIKGRVNALPTTWQMITLVIGTVFTILGGSFAILKFGLPHAP